MIQTALRDLGFAPGAVDGIYGLKTKAAAEAWLASGGKATSEVFIPQTTSMIYQGNARYPVREIIVHCSDTRPDWMADRPISEKRAEIRRWHMEDRGWRDIGYHWVIDRDGKIASGRLETVIGAHVEGHNSGTIGICLIGGHGCSASDQFSEHFTTAQDVTLRGLLQGIGMRTQISTISGHNQYAAKACPGFHVPTWLKGAAK